MAMKKYALCLSNDFGNEFSGDDVLPGLVYETTSQEKGMLRIVDESGEDYLYPETAFLLLTEAQSAQLEQSMKAAA